MIKKINKENDEELKGAIARQLAFFINNLVDNAHLNLKEEIPDNVNYFYIIFFRLMIYSISITVWMKLKNLRKNWEK